MYPKGTVVASVIAACVLLLLLAGAFWYGIHAPPAPTAITEPAQDIMQAAENRKQDLLQLAATLQTGTSSETDAKRMREFEHLQSHDTSVANTAAEEQRRQDLLKIEIK
ncbi:MAG TPA: hypothetical protein VHD31_00725 [Candidatus Paceibacterota bacterium]|nr:hypothetical protein [Candidatus Paceibacterota bacterium]